MCDLNIASQHEKLVHGQFVALSEAGILKEEKEGTWKVTKVPTHFDNMLEELDRLDFELPQFGSEVELQRASGPNLAGVLSGEVDPLEVLFPGGSGTSWSDFIVKVPTFRSLTLR